MPDFGATTLLLIALIGAACVIACLYAVSAYADRERTIIDLRAQVGRLRTQYADHLAELAAREAGSEPVLEVSPVDDQPAPAPATRQAA